MFYFYANFEIKSLTLNPWNSLAINRMYAAHPIWLVDVQAQKAVFQQGGQAEKWTRWYLTLWRITILTIAVGIKLQLLLGRVTYLLCGQHPKESLFSQEISFITDEVKKILKEAFTQLPTASISISLLPHLPAYPLSSLSLSLQPSLSSLLLQWVI